MTSWQRLPNEPMRWYARFEAYRLAGPNRSLLGTYNAEQDKEGQKRTPNPPTSWRNAMIKYQWAARAEAWDIQEQARITAEREAYLRSLPREFDTDYRFIYEEAIKAWQRSLEDAITTIEEVIKGDNGDERLKVQKKTEGQSGNPALLAQAMAARKSIREMLGIDAAAKIEHSGPDGGPIQFTEVIVELPTDESMED